MMKNHDRDARLRMLHELGACDGVCVLCRDENEAYNTIWRVRQDARRLEEDARLIKNFDAELRNLGDDQ